MIKLTRYSPKGHVFASPPHIAAMERIDNNTTKIQIGRDWIFVLETPEEIMATPEMQKYLNPLVVLKP